MDLHSLRPYDFRKADDATYYFETENGLKYRAYFIEFPATFYKLYSFSFEKEEGNAPYDKRVKDTIVTVLADFFDSENYILGYTCDVTDGREMARKRLFCGGVNDPHEIAGNSKLQEAYELGKNI